MSSGSWLTLHNCEIYYLLAVNYDPAPTYLIFIRVNIYPGPGEGDSQLIYKPMNFIRVTVYPAALSHNISSSVADPDPNPDPPDPRVFGPPGSGYGSTSQRYGSGSGSFYHHAKIVRKTLIPTI
jgi:hypothetical protein